jgi:hypothetical protein
MVRYRTCTYLFFLSFRVYNLVAERSSFDANINVSVFETNIRIVGGLISAHLMARRAGVQLEQGKQLEYSSLLHIFRQFITVPVQFFALSEGLTIISISVADPGSGIRNRFIPDPGSRISDLGSRIPNSYF